MDVHAEVLLDSIDTMERLAAQFAGRDNPVADIDRELEEALDAFVTGLRKFDPIRLIEVARFTFLPLAPLGMVAVDPEATAAHVELLSLIALAATSSGEGGDPGLTQFQEMSGFASEAREHLERLLHLGQLRAIADADPDNKLVLIELFLRASLLRVRNSSYPEMTQGTLIELFDSDPDVHAILIRDLGFDAATALRVLEGCHELQLRSLNGRMFAMGEAMSSAMASVQGKDALDPAIRDATSAKLESAFEPDSEACTVGIDELATHTGIAAETIARVINQFRLNLGSAATPTEVVRAFIAGKNPLRTRPIIVADDERIMLPHNALNADAVKEAFEEHLKSNRADWAKYDSHRGRLLERRTSAALNRVLPGAKSCDGLQYYVPANEKELAEADPAKYTKRVETDHLLTLDDVALIVEDKAVALSALAKGGKTARLRTDLTGIITKAAEQAGRLRDAIERDGGIRVHNKGWVDLGHIREIHTIAVGLDDLTAITTATAELVRAGLLDYDNIPWTVSLHDLELIVELIERPAQFLLYLRRRLNVDATVMFSAPDELDLFLFFFEDGLWVEPDPDQVRAAFPFLPPATSGELRRYRQQRPALITSRTDALDQWYYSTRAALSGVVPVPKPTMVASPLADLVDALHARGSFGWLSIGATLLEGATAFQHKLATVPRDLLDQPTGTSQGRSYTVPITSSVRQADGWLLVWATRPVGADHMQTASRLKDYMRAKKYQLGLPRGALFLYDEGTRDLVDVFYDGHIGELDAELSAKLSYLKPPSAHQGRLPPNAKKAPIHLPSTAAGPTAPKVKVKKAKARRASKRNRRR